MESLLTAFRAAADSTRLRLLALCAEGEHTVTELVEVLGQSQPRVSRHLKLLCDAGLLERFREGTWVFHRLPGSESSLARRLLAFLPTADSRLIEDQRRLAALKAERIAGAEAYFRRHAADWDRIRALHVAQDAVDSHLRDHLLAHRPRDLIDIGTGTGHILGLLGGAVEAGYGVDISRDMLAVARARLERAGLNHCSVRQADMYALPFPEARFDLAVLHQVLHFADHPARAMAEAARVVRPGGRVAVIDFAPHAEENLRVRDQHRRLGFSDAEIDNWCVDAGLILDHSHRFPGDPLTVVLWVARKPSKSSGA